MQRDARRLGLVAIFGALMLWSGPAAAQPAGESAAKPTAWFEFGFWDDFQLFGRDVAIHGLRFNLGAAENREVRGVDLFGLGNLTSGDQIGTQLGFYNRVGGDLAGLQLGVFASEVEGRTRGLQVASLYNRADEAGGGQMAAFLNRASRVRGLQIALWNDAEDLEGLQIGLVNVVRNGWIPVFPLLNVGPLRRSEVSPADEGAGED